MGRVGWRRGRLSSAEEAAAHPALVRLARRLGERDAIDAAAHDGARRAAVAAVFRVNGAEPELLFIERAIADGDPWSGHIAFPGGRAEPGDRSLEMTAIRETIEEVALDLTQGRMLGRLDDLAPFSATLPSVTIRPFVAVVDSDVTFTRSREVAAAFWVPLATLARPETIVDHVLALTDGDRRFAAYQVGNRRIWGLTERIVSQLLKLISD